MRRSVALAWSLGVLLTLVVTLSFLLARSQRLHTSPLALDPSGRLAAQDPPGSLSSLDPPGPLSALGSNSVLLNQTSLLSLDAPSADGADSSHAALRENSGVPESPEIKQNASVYDADSGLAPSLPFVDSPSTLLAVLDRYLSSTSAHNGPALLEYYRGMRSPMGAGGTLPLPVVSLHPFDYLLNCAEAPCGGQDVFLVALVPSGVTHHALRTLVRTTWAQPSLYALPVRVVFMLGRPERDPTGFLQGALLQEQALHKDLVQEEFIDTYDNLTLKTVAGLRWVTRYCAHARYVLKIDDHVFVNLFAVLTELLALPWYPSYILGNVHSDAGTHRSGKWGVSQTEWSLSRYPVFVVGPAYVLSGSLVPALYRASLHVPRFRLEDVYTTGFVALFVSAPPPRYVHWGERYCLSLHPCFTPALMASGGRAGGPRHFFAHVEETTHYPGVWARVVKLDLDLHRSAVRRATEALNLTSGAGGGEGVLGASGPPVGSLGDVDLEKVLGVDNGRGLRQSVRNQPQGKQGGQGNVNNRWVALQRGHARQWQRIRSRKY